ncbi:uncharacterized protein CLUP02_05261 [Colletotrichum lupini]|uniref:Uncharacterized protein n=1 Tax=Colletotrichum lupini TaxID=145971 RepID=A0A9Q8SMZ4_9PEZI|nr:uncharacterized protein CLUP02_05261 [Colletotrichum lupini]UQC79781.1 hypothetical protein CLUP02_05261 [Colletotrichum lupini]
MAARYGFQPDQDRPHLYALVVEIIIDLSLHTTLFSWPSLQSHTRALTHSVAGSSFVGPTELEARIDTQGLPPRFCGYSESPFTLAAYTTHTGISPYFIICHLDLLSLTSHCNLIKPHCSERSDKRPVHVRDNQSSKGPLKENQQRSAAAPGRATMHGAATEQKRRPENVKRPTRSEDQNSCSATGQIGPGSTGAEKHPPIDNFSIQFHSIPGRIRPRAEREGPRKTRRKKKQIKGKGKRTPLRSAIPYLELPREGALKHSPDRQTDDDRGEIGHSETTAFRIALHRHWHCPSSSTTHIKRTIDGLHVLALPGPPPTARKRANYVAFDHRSTGNIKHNTQFTRFLLRNVRRRLQNVRFRSNGLIALKGPSPFSPKAQADGNPASLPAPCCNCRQEPQPAKLVLLEKNPYILISEHTSILQPGQKEFGSKQQEKNQPAEKETQRQHHITKTLINKQEALAVWADPVYSTRTALAGPGVPERPSPPVTTFSPTSPDLTPASDHPIEKRPLFQQTSWRRSPEVVFPKSHQNPSETRYTKLAAIPRCIRYSVPRIETSAQKKGKVRTELSVSTLHRTNTCTCTCNCSRSRTLSWGLSLSLVFLWPSHWIAVVVGPPGQLHRLGVVAVAVRTKSSAFQVVDSTSPPATFETPSSLLSCPLATVSEKERKNISQAHKHLNLLSNCLFSVPEDLLLIQTHIVNKWNTGNSPLSAETPHSGIRHTPNPLPFHYSAPSNAPPRSIISRSPLENATLAASLATSGNRPPTLPLADPR